ncbi:MAG: tRNA uridine-5-carboxymethylaminomethyl(34) synthesis GTPase MnmE [Oscillospiraceae bacterium]|jgi:tRNA modification GTPase|nr:tRNA uridine-5-carboxymethylaminomethyl(34) synthesis GTPase MnmE [Oscillospiraceae bacterium]
MAIAAISTPFGTGGIAVIRISGGDALQIADSIFAGSKKLHELPPNTGAVGKIVDPACGQKIDEAVALVFKAPHSYTGEDVVEISCHGGVVVANQVLRAAIDAGARLANPGEFTKTAFLNGKIDLLKAEGVIDIINAKTNLAAKAALAVKGGAISKKCEKIKENLVAIAAHLCAWADFPEEDIAQVEFDALLNSVEENKTLLQAILQTAQAGKLLKNGVQTVIIGKPNSGKSSLMNALAGFDKSIVTDIAGTTRDVVTEEVNIGGIVLHLADTAGIRQTEDKIEQIGVKRAKNEVKTAQLCLCVFDSSLELTAEDDTVLQQAADENAIFILNKSDLPQKLDEKRLQSYNKPVVKISAKTGKGLGQLKDEIIKICNIGNIDPGAGIIANERQFCAVQNACTELEQAAQTLKNGYTFDAVTVNVESAVDSLMELSGERASEEIVDAVFHSFCVGK